jgi:hypothetical protein
MYGGFWGLGRPICCLGLSVVRVPHASSSDENCLCLSASNLDWVFLSVVCVFPVSPVQSAVVVPLFLWEYLLACCLIGPLLFLIVSVIVKGGLNVYSCKICVLHRQLFFKSDPSGLEFKGLVPLVSICKLRAFSIIYHSTCYLFKKKINK